jgi:Mannosyltransferase (PIG-V)
MTSLRGLIGVVALSRAVVVVAALLAEGPVGRNPALTAGDPAPILRSLTSWDGWWYLGIVRDGYHVQPIVGGYHDYAFLPAWPALIRLLSWPWPDYAGLVAVLLANLLFVLGIILLAWLGETVLEDDRATRGAALLALLPFSAVFSMAYAESLFLCLAAGALLAAERDRRALAGILVGLAALTRLQGAVLALPVLLVIYLRDDRRLRPTAGWVLLGPIAAVGFVIGVGVFAGGASAYGAAQAAWGRAGIGAAAADQSLAWSLSLINVVQLATLLIAVFSFVYARADRIRVPYLLVAVLPLVLVFASGTLESVGRHVTSAFPFAWILAGRRAAWFRIGWPIVSAGLLLVASTAMFAGRFVP